MYAITNKNAAAPKAAPQSLSSTAGGICGCCGCGWATATATGRPTGGRIIRAAFGFGFGTTNATGSGSKPGEGDRVVDRCTLDGDPPLDGEGERVSDSNLVYAPGRTPGRTGEWREVVLT